MNRRDFFSVAAAAVVGVFTGSVMGRVKPKGTVDTGAVNVDLIDCESELAGARDYDPEETVWAEPPKVWNPRVDPVWTDKPNFARNPELQAAVQKYHMTPEEWRRQHIAEWGVPEPQMGHYDNVTFYENNPEHDDNWAKAVFIHNSDNTNTGPVIDWSWVKDAKIRRVT